MKSQQFGVKTHQRGSIVPMAALSMAALLGFMGLSLDMGNLMVAQSQLRNAADSAVLAGAAALSNPQAGASLPNFGLASTNAAAALPNLGNQSSGMPVIVGNISTGGWDPTGASKVIQPWVPGSGLVPAVQVMVTKAGANGLVQSFFARIFNITGFSPTVTVVAMGNFSPGTADANQLLPVVLTQCVFDQFWDSAQQQPKKATQTTPLCDECLNQVVGQPMIIRIGSGWGSNQINGETSASCPATGIWTTFDSGSNADSVIVDEIENKYSKTVSVGQSIYETPGAKSNIYNKIEELGLPYGAFVPVVAGNTAGKIWATVNSFACVKIVSSDGGSGKYIDLQLLPVSNQPVPGLTNQGFSCQLQGTGATSGSPYVTAPPVIAN